MSDRKDEKLNNGDLREIKSLIGPGASPSGQNGTAGTVWTR